MSFFNSNNINFLRQQLAKEGNHLPVEVLQFIYKERLFKLFVPDELNGRMTRLPEALKVFERAAYIDGSFGWLVTIGSGGGYFSSMFDKEVSKKYFSPANAVVAGSGYASGIAKKIAGGYLVSGQWKYCSGAAYATMFTANCTLEDGSIRSFIFTPEQVQIINDWNAFGLKGTGSDSIKVVDAFVPANMTFDIENGTRKYSDPIFNFPFLQFAESSFAAVCIGIGTHFLDEAKTLVADNKKHWDSNEPERGKFIEQVLHKHSSELNIGVTAFYNSVEECWKNASAENLNRASYASKNISAAFVKSAQDVFPHLGMAVLVETSAINRCYRDLLTAGQHVLLKKYPS